MGYIIPDEFWVSIMEDLESYYARGLHIGPRIVKDIDEDED